MRIKVGWCLTMTPAGRCPSTTLSRSSTRVASPPCRNQTARPCHLQRRFCTMPIVPTILATAMLGEEASNAQAASAKEAAVSVPKPKCGAAGGRESGCKSCDPSMTACVGSGFSHARTKRLQSVLSGRDPSAPANNPHCLLVAHQVQSEEPASVRRKRRVSGLQPRALLRRGPFRFRPLSDPSGRAPARPRGATVHVAPSGAATPPCPLSRHPVPRGRAPRGRSAQSPHGSAGST